MMNDLLLLLPRRPSVRSTQQNKAKLRDASNLGQDKIDAAGLAHVVGQINPLADPGVTFRRGCEDVSAGVQQPPVVAVIGWRGMKEREGGERGGESDTNLI